MTKRSPTPPNDPSGRYSYGGLERIMHERARLGILTSLASHPKGLPFNDLKELCAIKTSAGYELPTSSQTDDDQIAAVAELLRSIQPAGPNLLVVKTAIGAAQRVALAFDRCSWPEVIGNIGGDDTVFVATESGIAQKNLITRIEHSARS
jgi:hypothetical protein